jgi:hypothetical protein
MKFNLLSILLSFATLSHATNLTITNNLNINSNITDLKFRIGSPKSGQEFVKLDDIESNSSILKSFDITKSAENISSKAIFINGTYKVPVFLSFTVPANTFKYDQPKLFYTTMFLLDPHEVKDNLDVTLTKTSNNDEKGNLLLSATINNDKATTAMAYPNLISSTNNWPAVCGHLGVWAGVATCDVFTDHLLGNVGLTLIMSYADGISQIVGNFSSNYSLEKLAEIGDGIGGNTLKSNFIVTLFYSHGEVWNGDERVAWFNGGGLGIGYAGGDSVFCGDSKVKPIKCDQQVYRKNVLLH